jgi:hypothetical protein
MNNRIQDGYEIKIWIGKEDLNKVDVEEIFDKIEEFFSKNWDDHGPDDQCVLTWGLSGGPTYTTQEEIDEFNDWLASLPKDEGDD